MAVRGEALIDLLALWSAAPDHWVVLGGDRRTGKSSALRALADGAGDDGRPFVLWEYPEKLPDAPWDLLETPGALLLLDDWPTVHPDLQPPIHLEQGRGLITVTDAGPWRQPLTGFPEDTWPFPRSTTVVWVTLRREPNGTRITWHAHGNARNCGSFRLTAPSGSVSPAFRVFRDRATCVYAYPACDERESDTQGHPCWRSRGV